MSRLSRWRSLLPVLRPPDVRAERARLMERVREVSQKVAALGPSERAELAAEAKYLAELREKIGERTGTPEACRGCASRLPDADPDFPGGFCCGGGTDGVTPGRELLPLVLAGVRLDRARTTSALAGCIFRRERGCTLSARERPSLCVAYMCTELRAELAERGEAPEIGRLADELTAAITRMEARLERACALSRRPVPADTA